MKKRPKITAKMLGRVIETSKEGRFFLKNQGFFKNSCSIRQIMLNIGNWLENQECMLKKMAQMGIVSDFRTRSSLFRAA